MMVSKEEHAKLICMFLAEQLRVNKISLRRAAEIAQKVLNNMNLIDSEQDLLVFIRDLSKDFEELIKLEDRVFFWKQANERKDLESSVRAYVIETIYKDPDLALKILNEAIKDEAKLEDLKQKFPSFAEFLARQ